eukprot:m.337788 g.337788  ORF g.337788 m.337788 type:complete len:291 (+) comp18233_c0_seq1:50-922(+)
MEDCARSILTVTLASNFLEAGFDAENKSNEIDHVQNGDIASDAYHELGAGGESPMNLMLEATESVIRNLIQSTQNYATLHGRTDANVLDCKDALVKNGIDLHEISTFLGHLIKEENELEANGKFGNGTKHLEPEEMEDESFVINDDEHGVLYDEECRQERPQYMLDHLPNLPEPHAYMKTAVYYKPMKEYAIWRRENAKQRHLLSVSMTKLAIETTSPKPVPLTYGHSPRNVPLPPLISRPRRSSSFIDCMTTSKDPGLSRLSNMENAIKSTSNPYFLPLNDDKEEDEDE